MSASKIEICGVWDASVETIPPALPANVVHVWQRRLSNDDPQMDSCFELLSSEEREKAARYRIERPRSDYILTRGTLRALLGRYLGNDPRKISFRYAQKGKPYISGETDLQFNVSHSDGLAVLAFAHTRELGIDVERIVPKEDLPKIAERFFSPAERARMRNISGSDLHAAFYRCWTRKEAYIKATGDGLSLHLHQFDVSLEPNPEQALLATRPEASEARRWKISNLSVAAQYAAALAVASQDRES